VFTKEIGEFRASGASSARRTDEGVLEEHVEEVKRSDATRMARGNAEIPPVNTL